MRECREVLIGFFIQARFKCVLDSFLNSTPFQLCRAFKKPTKSKQKEEEEEKKSWILGWKFVCFKLLFFFCALYKFNYRDPSERVG